MSRFLWIVPTLFLGLGSQAALAQESIDTRRVLAETTNSIASLLEDATARSMDLGRRLAVLKDLADAADSVTPLTLNQSLSRARQKVEEARREASKEPPLGEPVPAVIDIVSNFVDSPPFGTSADRLRARLFVEIGKLEEDCLRRADSFQSEATGVDTLDRELQRITASLRTAAVAAGKTSLAVRRMALKSGS
jgi:hypothetical protein